MSAPFALHSANINGPSFGAFIITPSDTVDLPKPIRKITLGDGNGTLRFIGWDGNTYETETLHFGTYDLLAVRILATGTTATKLTGWL